MTAPRTTRHLMGSRFPSFGRGTGHGTLPQPPAVLPVPQTPALIPPRRARPITGGTVPVAKFSGSVKVLAERPVAPAAGERVEASAGPFTEGSDPLFSHEDATPPDRAGGLHESERKKARPPPEQPPAPSLAEVLSLHPLLGTTVAGPRSSSSLLVPLPTVLSHHPLLADVNRTDARNRTSGPPPSVVAALSQHQLVGKEQPASLVAALSQHPLFADAREVPGPEARTDDSGPAPSLVAALSQHPLLADASRHSLPRGGCPQLPRSARKALTPRRRTETSAKTVTAPRRPLPPRPGRVLARTPDVYVSASRLNRNSTAKQRGRRGYREPIVDAGWGLFLARDMKKDATVLDYRFVDGRGGVEVDRLDAAQLKERYPDPMLPATHVLKVWNSSTYWDTLRCQGIGGFANSQVGQQNCSLQNAFFGSGAAMEVPSLY